MDPATTQSASGRPGIAGPATTGSLLANSEIALTEDFPDLRRWTERRPAVSVALRLAALVFIGATLAKAGERAAWPWAAVALAAGAVWTWATARQRPAAAPAAIAFGLCGTVMAGCGWGEPTGLTFMFVCILYLQAVVEPRVIAIYAGATLLAVGTICTLAANRPTELSWIVGIIIGGYLFGDARRSRMLALQRAKDLLAMTRRANAEQAHAAALAERGRIAREVHDVLAHSLSGLALQLEAADALLSKGGHVDAAHTMVVRARRLAREGLGEVRRAVAALREDVKPPEVTLARLVEDYAADTGWEASFEMVGKPVPALAVETAQGLQRVAQEALTNARKHAPGAGVAVRLEVEAEQITLTVVNGTPSERPSNSPTSSDAEGSSSTSSLADSGGGWGIVGLRERVGLLGGTLTAERTESGGWQVIATVPIVTPDIFHN